MKCECGQEITERQDLLNEKVARETKTKKLNMCDLCWANYCYHAETGN